MIKPFARYTFEAACQFDWYKWGPPVYTKVTTKEAGKEVMHVKLVLYTSGILYFTIWLAPSAGIRMKMNQILHCDWLPKQTR